MMCAWAPPHADLLAVYHPILGFVLVISLLFQLEASLRNFLSVCLISSCNAVSYVQGASWVLTSSNVQEARAGNEGDGVDQPCSAPVQQPSRRLRQHGERARGRRQLGVRPGAGRHLGLPKRLFLRPVRIHFSLSSPFFSPFTWLEVHALVAKTRLPIVVLLLPMQEFW